jgi:hypothetical protein
MRLEQIPGVSESIVASLDRLKNQLTEAAGQNLAGLILYGGLARGRYRPGRSDVNVVVLLHDMSVLALAAIAPALREARRAAGVDPLLFTPSEVPQLAEAFPTKFLDIKKYHIVLAGPDPFSQLEITREQIRLRTAQGLRNLLLRLRHRFVALDGDVGMLSQTLERAARSFALELQTLLQLAGKEVPAEDRSALVFEAAVTAFGLERGPLARLAELRQDARTADDATTLYRGVLAAVARAVAVADGMRESPR